MIRLALARGSRGLRMDTPIDGFDPKAVTEHEKQLDEKCQAAIGYLVASAASAEITLGLQIIATISHDKNIQTAILPLTSGQETTVKLGILRTIVQHRVSEQDRLKLNHILSRLQKCFDKRNALCHGLIIQDKATGKIKATPLKIEGTERKWAQPRLFDAEQVRGYGREIYFQIRALEKELIRLGAAPTIASLKE